MALALGGRLRTGTIIAFVISLFVQVGFPLAATLLVRRWQRAPWALYVYGALIYAVFQLFTWLPLNVYLDAVLGARITTELQAFIWLMSSAVAGALIEEGGRWLGYRYLFPRIKARYTWRNGIMYGLGHGSVETLLLFAGLTFVTMLAYVVLGQLSLDGVMQSLNTGDSAALADALREILDMTWSGPLVVAAERLLALPHQVAWALMVMASLVHGRKRWFVFAVAYHASIAVIVPSLARLAGFAVAEGVNLVLAVLSLLIISKLSAFCAPDPVSLRLDRSH
jgi:uncharacterized membrane protein YhfC